MSAFTRVVLGEAPAKITRDANIDLTRRGVAPENVDAFHPYPRHFRSTFACASGFGFGGHPP